MDHATHAMDLFMQGYNCAQAVAVAFCDTVGVSREQMAKLASPFGGGMGRLREVCGAVSGMYLVLGLLYGYDTPGDDESKKLLYQQVQALAGRFKEQHKTIICRELLDNPPSDPNPSPRTADFYAKRPCARFVYTAAKLMDEFIAEHPLENQNG